MLFYFIFCFSKPTDHQKELNENTKMNIIYIEKLYDYPPELEKYLQKYQNLDDKEKIFDSIINIHLKTILSGDKHTDSIDFEQISTNYERFREVIDYVLLPENTYQKIQKKINEENNKSMNEEKFTDLMRQISEIYIEEFKTTLEEVYLYHLIYNKIKSFCQNRNFDSFDIYPCIKNEFIKSIYYDLSAKKIRKNKNDILEKYNIEKIIRGDTEIIFNITPFFTFLFLMFNEHKNIMIENYYEIIEGYLFVNILHLRCLQFLKKICLHIVSTTYIGENMMNNIKNLSYELRIILIDKFNKINNSLKEFIKMDIAKICEEIKRENINLELKMNEQVKKILDKYYTENYQKVNISSHVNVTETEVNPYVQNHEVERETYEKTKDDKNAKINNNEAKNLKRKHDHIKDSSE